MSADGRTSLQKLEADRVKYKLRSTMGTDSEGEEEKPVILQRTKSNVQKTGRFAGDLFKKVTGKLSGDKRPSTAPA